MQFRLADVHRAQAFGQRKNPAEAGLFRSGCRPAQPRGGGGAAQSATGVFVWASAEPAIKKAAEAAAAIPYFVIASPLRAGALQHRD
jgi:hypothetical protein